MRAEKKKKKASRHMPGSPLPSVGSAHIKITMIAQNLQKKEAKPLQDKSPLLIELHHYYKLTTNILYHREKFTASRKIENIRIQILLSEKLCSRWAGPERPSGRPSAHFNPPHLPFTPHHS